MRLSLVPLPDIIAAVLLQATESLRESVAHLSRILASLIGIRPLLARSTEEESREEDR